MCHRETKGVSQVKNPACNAGDIGDGGSIPGSGNGNPFQYSCLENPMERGANEATVYVVTKSQMCLSDGACTIREQAASNGLRKEQWLAMKIKV